jgi:hypothetical protein
MYNRGRWALVVATSLVAGGVAEAQPAPTPAELQQARVLFAQAEKDERAGEWGAALEKLRKVAQIKVTPGIRFHTALCEERLDQLVPALEDYARAEAQANTERNMEVLAALKDPLAALRARIPRLIVRVPPDVKGTSVTLDDKPLAPGYWGAELPVERGTHVVSASATGRRPFSKSLATPEHEITVVDVVLEDQTKTAPPSPPPLPTVGGNQPPPPPPPMPSDGPKGQGGGKTGAILATAGAVALVGLGVGAFLTADGKQSDAKEQCATQTDCEDLRGPVRAWDALALGAWIGAGALGTIAVVLWIAPSERATTTGRLYVGPGTAGIAGSF